MSTRSVHILSDCRALAFQDRSCVLDLFTQAKCCTLDPSRLKHGIEKQEEQAVVEIKSSLTTLEAVVDEQTRRDRML